MNPVAHHIHLMCDSFKPILARFYSRNHRCKFGPDNCLCCQGFTKDDPLCCPPDSEKSVTALIKNHEALYFKHSSTTSRCAAMEVAQTIQRSWLKLERMTDIPAPIGPKVLETGTRT